jgi:glycosyltransferase involved in cell wall biosynthesis
MTKTPLVSVIVPTYNRAHTLGRTLRSILDQTFRDYEVIVVDDGSTDETCTLVESSLQGVSFRYIYQANGGVAKARDTGMKACLGEYLAFCDSDDLWFPEKLERQMALFTPDTALVFSDAYACAEMLPQPIARFRCSELNMPFRGEVYRNVARRNFIVTSSVVVRRQLLSGFVAWPVTNYEDWQMWLWVAPKGPFEYVAEPLVYYYEHSQGISKHKAEAAVARRMVRKEELVRMKKAEVAQDVKLMKAMNLLILKDTLLICVLKTMPSGILKRLIALYYKSLPLRKAALKMGIGS